ncbi:hypothetical protein BpHYR1_053030 [Brachionus plicatilis]|uniref:Uncharacterized protein n=1 Tax=Brachionus plicatilis TaxID=10195 RepID=A0A3M7T037_BRAPC|nr:hypothetical protein BpHYR1_053030 [Brachionus plicatilis]
MSSSQSSSSEQKINYSFSPTSGQYQLANVHFPSAISHNYQLNVNPLNQHQLPPNLQNYSLSQMHHQHQQYLSSLKNHYYSKQSLDFEASCEDYDDEQNQHIEESENKNDDSGFQTNLSNQIILSSQEQKTPNKIRKRSANQAYEYLTSLADSKTFQTWLSNNETDFTWVHKRNSMTNAGKKYYYICNYRIKKGYHRCPAVIYALFPNNNDSTVMVYSCGEHEHKRISFNDNAKPTSATELKPSSQKVQANKSKPTSQSYQSSNGSYSSSSASTPPSIQNILNNSQILAENYTQKIEHDDENENACLNDTECDDHNDSCRIKSNNTDNENYEDMDDIIDDDENINQDMNNNEPLTSQSKNADEACEKSPDHSKYLNSKSLSLGYLHSTPQSNTSPYLNPLRQLNLNKQFQEFNLINNSNKSLINSNYLLAKALSAQQHNQNLGNSFNQISTKQMNQRKRPLSSLTERIDCDEEFFSPSVQSIQNHFNSNCHQMNNHLSMYPQHNHQHHQQHQQHQQHQHHQHHQHHPHHQHHQHHRNQQTHMASNLVASQQALVNHLTSNRLSLNNNFIQANKSLISNQISSLLPSQINAAINHQNQSTIVNNKNSATSTNPNHPLHTRFKSFLHTMLLIRRKSQRLNDLIFCTFFKIFIDELIKLRDV